MGLTIKVTLTQNSQNIANNTSSVTAKVIANYTSGSWNQIGNDGVLTLNGTKYNFIGKFNTGKSSGSGSNTMYTVTATIPHNADGSKTVTASVSYPTTTWGDKSASASLKLTQIPRQATMVSAPNFNDEGNPTITYSNPAGSAVTSLKACISLDGSVDDIAYRDISKTGTSYTFNLTTAERNVLRNATTTSNSRTVRFYVQTVIGSTTYLHYLSKTLSIVNATPTLSPTVEDIDADMLLLTGDKTKYIRYYSNPKYTTNATALKGASISKYSVTCGGVTRTTATGEFYNIESDSIKFTVTDSRGNSASKTVSLSMIDYIKLTCNPMFSPPTTSGDMTFPIRGSFFTGNFGLATNELTVQYRYKYTTDTGAVVNYGEWITVTPTIDDTTYVANVSLTGLNYLYSYTFQTRAWDAITIVTTDEKSIQTLPVFDWGKNDFNVNGDFGLSGKGTVLRRNGENGNIVLSAPDATDGVFIRPNGTGDATGQVIVKKNGAVRIPNSAAFASLNPDGVERRLLTLNSFNATALGYDGYANNEGETDIYGNTVYIMSKNDVQVNNDMVLANTMGIGIKDSAGTNRWMVMKDSTNTDIFGSGGYNASQGGAYYRGNQVYIQSKGHVYITAPSSKQSARAYGVNKVLWSGGWFMTDGHTCTLSEAVTAQPHGIVLCWSYYTSSTTQNYNWNFQFVPKNHVASHPGTGVTSFMLTGGGAEAASKYLYINDTTITGYSGNTGSSTSASISMYKSNFVLRYVIGV